MKKSSTIYKAALFALFMIVKTALGGDYGDIRFREFPRDRDIFERYTVEADRNMSAEEWQRVVDSGREEMTAAWERNALAECDRFIREGFDSDRVLQAMEEARAQWESGFDDALLYEKGSWRARQGAISYTTGTMTGLKERVNDAGNAGLTDTAAWESYVAGAVQDTESTWESVYAPETAGLNTSAESLTGKEKEGFLAEVIRIENDLRQRFDIEKDTILYLGKTGFIEKKRSGNRTLREESESRSAEVITDNILSDTESQIRAEEERILRKNYSAESGSRIDFTGLGENWQEELKKIIDYGMGKWESAREKLYNELVSWKKTAEEAFQTAEAKWREGLRKLEAARLEWETKLAQEIYAGLDEWEQGNSELDLNTERSRSEFTEYMESMSGRWSDGNRDLVDLAVNGSAVYADAVDNIKWLTEMRESTAAQYAFSSYDESFKNAIGEELAGQVEAAIQDCKNRFMQQHMYDTDYSQSIEVVLTQAAKPGYSDAAGTFTETYTISVVENISQRITRDGDSVFGRQTYTKETKRTAWTRNWNNVVTLESDRTRRTANCYYAFELARWQRIRESFSTIASDAEFYMHERNMEGREEGAGYLTNASGNYGANAVGSADPYLMTQAEYSLELAERDMAFWNQRLEIARSVLEYAEGTTRETAAKTEENMTAARGQMESAKAAYDNALAAVNNILAELRNIQGLQPLTDDAAAWQRYYDSYNSNIENLAKVYSNAETALKSAEDDYSKAKAAFIVYKNMTGEDGGVRPVEYLKNEIIEIERNIVRVEQSINRQREELFIKQNEADFTARTTGFAGLYGDMVKKHEKAKDRVDLFRSIIKGAESEADVAAWAAAISANRQVLWGDESDEYYAVVQAALDAYNSATGDDRAVKRDNVLLEIRRIYLSLNASVNIYRKSIEMLRDSDFDPEAFADTEYIADHDVYADYARYSAEAIGIIEQYFDDADAGRGEKSYNDAWGFLKAELDKRRYVYGENNSDYIIHYTALKYFEERYKGLTAETWGAYRQRLASESDYAENAIEIHEDMAGGESAGTLAKMERRASEGDIEAVQYLREYYAAGSGIPGLAYIKEYDARADIADYIDESLKNFAIENSLFFINKENLQKDHNYLDDLYGFITSAITMGSTPGENLFSVEAFRDMEPVEISRAAEMLQQYVANLEKSGMPVPESIRTAAAEISEIKKNLDTELFILSYMNSMMSGTAEEILAAAQDAADGAKTAYAFLAICGDSIENGTSYNDIAMRIISAYEGLTGSQKLEIDGNETSGENRVSTFISNLYSHINVIDLAERERIYIMNMGEAAPADYAALLHETMREQFIRDTTPAYARVQYELAAAEGSVASIDDYISAGTRSGELDNETAESLRNYALIREYLDSAVKRPFSEQPHPVRVYLAEKFYYDMVFSGNANSRDIESLLEDEFGSDNINGDIVDEVEKYAGRLSAVLFYNGNTDAYIETLSPDAARYFQMYIYGEGSAILPGYEYGIYGRESVANGKLAIASGGLEREIDRFDQGFGGRIIAMEEYLGRVQADLDKAKALDSFVKTGVSEKNWRDNAVSVIDTGKVMGDDDVISTESTTVIEVVPVSGTGYMDGYDETGTKNVIMYSQNPMVRDSLSYSINGIIDDVNRIAGIFRTLGKSYETAAPAVNTITAFLEKADRAYNYLTGYVGTDGENNLDSCIDGANSANTIARAGIDDLYSGLMSMETAILSDKGKVVNNNEIIEQLGEKDEAALLADIETAQGAHQTREAEFQTARSSLDQAQENYRLANERYTDAMEDISETYSLYKAAEVEFERTSSIYEYANTPYLKESSTLDSGLGSATTVDGSGSTDYSELPVPDARENYERILTRYNEAAAVYRARQSAVDNQESVVTLNTNTDADGEYADYKADFVRKSESYIRICQTDEVLNEKVEGYRVDYEQKEAEYTRAKERIQFFADLSQEVKENKERMAELSDIRDRILSHIKTSADVTLYSDAMEWYGCWEVMNREGELISDSDYTLAMKIFADKFESLAGYVQQDIKDLYSNFGDGATLKKIQTNYMRYAYARYMKDYYEHRKKHTSLVKHPKRWYKAWKAEKAWREKREDAKADYTPHSNKIKDTLKDFVAAKTEYIPAYTKYVNAVSVKTLDDVKRYLGTANGYNLTDEDLRYLYDTTTTRVDVEGINAGTIRKDIQRKDIDGANVKVKYYEVEEEVNGQRVTRGKVVVLNKDQAETGETYNVTDAWIKVKLGGEEPERFEAGAVYDLYDNNYDIRTVSVQLRAATSGYRATYMTDLMGYVQQSAQSGTHDYTVMLRDLEDTYNDLKDAAVGFNAPVSGGSGEYRQRSFEGYTTVMNEFAWNENGSSVQQMIINEYIRQNRLYQEQLWQQQQEKYQQRRSRWEEITGYILNRGMRDWRQKGNDYLQKWRKWRIEAQKEIEAGKQWWTDRDIEMKQEMKTWGDDAVKAANKEAARKIYGDLKTTIDGYEKQIRKYMPGMDGIAVDTDSILNETMRNIPVGTLGVLNSTMFNTDRVAGMAEIFGFGNNAALNARNKEWQQEYESAFGVMRNLQVLDVLNGIIDNFNKQLTEANRNVYRSVEYDLRYSDTFGEADFVRSEKENLWTIRVCVESNLTGDKFKTKKFRDYVSMPNSTVMLKPIKGLDGEIDFTKPETYAGIDASELEVYVGLESVNLNDDIENVFEEGGLFGDYTEGEFERLNREFAKYYGQWAAGEALLDAGFYAKPMFPGGPNMMNVGVMAAGIAGGPWAGFAAQMLTTGIQVADGSMDWEKAAFSVGTSVLTAGIGVGTDYLGGVAGGPFLGAVVENTTRTLGNTVVSGIQYDPENGFGWDGDRMTSGRTWLAAGATAAAGSSASGSGFSNALVNGLGSSVSQGITTGDWKGSFKSGMTAAVGNYVGGLISRGMSVGLGVTDNTYTTTLINNYSTYGMRKALGSDENFDMNVIGNVDTINLVTQDMYARYNAGENRAKTAMQAGADDLQDEIDAENGRSTRQNTPDDPFELLDTALAGIFTSLGRGLGQTMADIGTSIRDGAAAAWEGVSTVAGMAWDEVTTAASMVTSGIQSLMASDDDGIQRIRTFEIQSSAGINPEGEDLAGKTVRSVYREGTNADKLVKRIVADRKANGEDVTEEMVKNDLMEANGLDVNDENSWKEMKQKFKAGGEIFEKERTSITRNVDKKYDQEVAERDKEKNASKVAGRQNTGYLSYELDYNTAGPNWGGSEESNNNIITEYSIDKLYQGYNGGLAQMLIYTFDYEPEDANTFASKACVANSTYIELLMSGAQIGTEEEFYSKHLDNKDINPKTANVNRYTEDIVKDYGYEQITLQSDNPYKDINAVDFDYGKATFKKWSERKQKEIEHTVTINKGNDGKVRIFADTGADGYRTTGLLYTEVFRRDKLVRFQYIKKRR
ncbi:MAG TPA: hypothetical protein PK514_14055 [Spirochaetota bacterium]|nr:hypothetical protein [Spirochaetota bacterium]